jgi:hypothetical protein
VNHKDGNKDNCHYSNLEWTTHSYNQKHSISNRLNTIPHYNGSKNPASKLKEHQILEIRSRAGQISNRKLAKEYGVSGVMIGNIIKRKFWSHI